MTDTDILKPIKEVIAQYAVLNHPFYQDWNKGLLNRQVLQEYAIGYYPHVKAFPQYISRLHSFCPTEPGRRMLLRNLNDEELGDENHPELWRRFARSLDVGDSDLEREPSQASRDLYSRFFSLCNESYAKGLGALYAYESQVPEVAEVKIDGLVNHYGVRDENGLSFFRVHREADVHHRREFEEEMSHLKPEELEEARDGAREGAKAVWDFLSSFNYH